MLERNFLSNQTIIDNINNYYNVKVVKLIHLPIGADANALVYKAETKDKSYFVKLRKTENKALTAPLLNVLHDNNIPIIFPVKTIYEEIALYIEGINLMIYPFIVGKNGFNQDLTKEQWSILGKSLNKLHTINLPISFKEKLRQEDYSPKFRNIVTTLYNFIDKEFISGFIENKLKDCMNEYKEVIHKIINKAEKAAYDLMNNNSEFVLCHSDIHAGNVLIDANNNIYIIDWDSPMMAPKERDLMFIGGGVGNVWNKNEEEDLFYKAYGKTNINKNILSYYRCERIIQDIAEFGKNIFFTNSNYETKLENYNHFEAMFNPNGVVEIALKTIK